VRAPHHPGYEISTDLSRIDIGKVHRWLSDDAYWAKGRGREVVARSLAGSLNFGLHRADGVIVGFARTVTDLATFGWLCDVYIEPAERGRGLGTWLVRTVRDHLHAHGVYRIILATWDAHEVYRRLGFTTLATPGNYLELMTVVTNPGGQG
jgi:GNAT superfamily N-acetyltransferase